MEIKMQTWRQPVPVTEVLLDEFDEQPVDGDFVLPDYFPDIAAVLKCSLRPVVQACQISGDRLLADGQTLIRVLYLDEGRKCVRSCEFSQPFSSTFAFRDDMTGARPVLTVRMGYVNCRAVSPRRLDVHGAFSVKLQMLAVGGREVVTEAAGGGVYTRTENVDYTVPVAFAEKTFTVSETLELGSGLPPAEALIRGEASPCLTECRQLPGKAILKGAIHLESLYAADTVAGDMRRVCHEIPFSQIVDAEGITEDSRIETALDVVGSDMHISADQNGNSTLLTVSVKLAARLRGYDRGTVAVVTDAYAAACPLQIETARLEAECLTALRRDVRTVRETFDLPGDEAAQVVDIWCEPALIGVRCEAGRAWADGRLVISLIAKDGGGTVAYYERPADFSLEFDERCDRAAVRMGLVKTDYTVSGGKVELRVELWCECSAYRTTDTTAITALTADEGAAYPPERAALRIVYATAGESVWDIAKAHRAGMTAILEENGLTGEILPADTMLLIPM